MTPISPVELQAARQQFRIRDHRTATLNALTIERDKLKARDDAWCKHLAERLDFRRHPEHLEGLTDLYRAVPPRYRRSVSFSYRSLLRDMIDPFPALDGHQRKPRTIDFAALPVAARCYLLGPYLGIQQNNRFAEIDLVQSRPPHHLVLVQTGGPVDAELWRSRTADISSWLSGGATVGTWTVTAHTSSTVTLTLQPPLPTIIPYTRRFLAAGALFAGIDVTTRKPVHIPFSELAAGTYIPGVMGTGKTSAIHVLLRSIFANLNLFEAVFLVDGKSAVAMHRYRDLHRKVRVLYEDAEVWQLASDLVDTMAARNIEQRTFGVEKATKDFIALVIDELPSFMVKPAKADRDAHVAFLTNLQLIATKGRSAGIRMFLITQTPVNEQIPTIIRSNCANTIAFRLPEQAHATSLFGALDSINDPRKLPTGQAILAQGETGTITRVQFPFAPLYQPGRFARP